MHFAKQHTRGKPIRFGYKNWAICSSTGCMYGFNIYTGKQEGIQYKFGLGGDVVLGFMEQISVPANADHTIYFDN